MRILTWIFVAAQTVALTGSVTSLADQVPVRGVECTIVRVAERYIAVHYPEFDSIKNPPIVQDDGPRWRVEYELPEGVIGGTPVVVVDKSTLKVERAYRTQ